MDVVRAVATPITGMVRTQRITAWALWFGWHLITIYTNSHLRGLIHNGRQSRLGDCLAAYVLKEGTSRTVGMDIPHKKSIINNNSLSIPTVLRLNV